MKVTYSQRSTSEEPYYTNYVVFRYSRKEINNPAVVAVTTILLANYASMLPELNDSYYETHTRSSTRTHVVLTVRWGFGEYSGGFENRQNYVEIWKYAVRIARRLIHGHSYVHNVRL